MKATIPVVVQQPAMYTVSPKFQVKDESREQE